MASSNGRLVSAGSTAAFLAMLGVVTFAQQSQPPPSPQPAPSAQQPVFRARTDLVSVYVVAVDDQGQPVHGLTKDDFELTDRKKRQEISVFDEVSHDETPSTPKFTLPPTLKRDVASNGVDLHDRLVVVVVDDLHMYKNRTDRAKSIARDLIDRLGPRTPMGLLFTSGKHSLPAITLDRALLLAAVDTLKGQRAVPRPMDAIDKQMADLTGLDMGDSAGYAAAASTAMSASLQEFFENLTFYKTLEDAGRMLLADDGRRKTFVLISEGIGKDLSWLPDLKTPCDSGPDLNPCYHDHAILDMMQSLRRANVATYAIDPRGEVDSKDLMKECLPSPPGMIDDPCFMGLTDWDSQVRQAQHGLEMEAKLTGGFAVTNTNDFEGGLNRIISDLDNYYLLGFYPADPTGGGFRALGVTLNRPGVTLRFRQGYEVGAAPPVPKGAKNPLTALALGMTAKSDLPLRLAASPFPGNGKNARVAATIEVSVARRDIEDPDGRISDELKYSLVVADMKSGKVVKQLTNTAKVSSQRPLGATAPPAVNYQMPLTTELPPGTYQFRASAISTKLGRDGSVFLDVDVPDFTKEAVALSGLVVGYGEGPRVRQARPTGAAQLVPFDPTLDRTFQTSDSVRVFFEIARKSPASTKATIELLDYADHGIHTEAPAIDGAAGVGQVDVTIPLKGLTPGAYRIRATATDGKTTATQEIGIMVR